MKNKFLFCSYWLLAIVLVFVSCDKDENERFLPPGKGIFVLNQGIMGKNDAGLSFYSTETGNFYADIQYGTLGDNAQSMFIFENKLFIAVAGSARILVLDLQSKKTWSDIHLTGTGNDVRMPRYFATDGSSIYVSTFDGYVLQINSSTYTIEKTVKVGPNPEGIAVVNGKIYVANSDGENYNNGYVNGQSVSVIDIASFQETKKIHVGMNPTFLQADEYGNVYVVCNGDYAANPAVFQKINTTDDSVTDLAGITASNFTIHNNTCYLYGVVYDEKWEASASVEYFNITEQNPVSQPFIKDQTAVGTPYAIAVDPVTEKVYISGTIANQPGTVYVFSQSGVKEKSFGVGFFPSCFAFYN